jgi:hypothetical protein
VAILLLKALLQTPSCNLNKWNCCDESGLTVGLTEIVATYFITLENVQNSWITVILSAVDIFFMLILSRIPLNKVPIHTNAHACNSHQSCHAE